MTETLIRRKVLAATRLLGQYYLVAIDGTGVLVFPERHCAHCLTRTQHGVTTYYHPVLEAKLVTTSGFAFSLMTEFIENPGAAPTKQDCELTAFYRGAPEAALSPLADLFALPMSPAPRGWAGAWMASMPAVRPSLVASNMAGNT
jgi:hypothetical protein